MSCESSVSLLKEAYSIWRSSFKQFLSIPKTTGTEVVYQMIGLDLIMKTRKIAKEKWEARKSQMECKNDKTWKVPQSHPLIGISNIFYQIIKLEARKCIACKRGGKTNILTQSHRDADHNIMIPGYQKLWTEKRDYFY